MLGKISSDIGLNIIEYGGDNFNATEQELVDRIRQYDKAFNLQEWRKNVEKKIQLRKRVDESLLKPILHFIREKDIQMYFRCERSAFDISAKDMQYNPDIYTLVQMFNDIQINAVLSTDEKDIHDNILCLMFMPNIEKIHKELLLISILECECERWDMGYLYGADAEQRAYIGIPNIENILSTPDTLSDYLRYAIIREREQINIINMREHTLFLMIDQYSWTTFDSNLIIHIEDIKVINAIYRELTRLYGNVSRYGNEYGRGNASECFHIPIEGISALEQINKFHHPNLLIMCSYL